MENIIITPESTVDITLAISWGDLQTLKPFTIRGLPEDRELTRTEKEAIGTLICLTVNPLRPLI